MQYTVEQLKIILDNHKKWLYENLGARAYLSRAYLSRANLSGADLSGADLSGADLSGAYLSGADLSGADLSGAYLYGADLSGAYLSRANLSGADLSGAYLYGADLSGADLYGANSDFSILLSISGMKWSILIKNDLVKVGCQEHKYNEWKSFSDKEIEKMSSDALPFYYGVLIPLLDYTFKDTEFKID